MENKIKNIVGRFRFTFRGALTAILCVAVAIVLWLSVMWIAAPEYTKEIDVTRIVISGEDKLAQRGITYDPASLEKSIEVSVQGSKTALYDLLRGSKEPYAVLDFGSVTKSGEHNVVIQFVMPDGIEIIEAPTHITVNFNSK